MIEVRHITKHFDTQQALQDVSFTIPEGSVTGLIGPNGSGKTTLIRIMNGVLGANSGQVTIQGIDTSSETEIDWQHLVNKGSTEVCSRQRPSPASPVERSTTLGRIVNSVGLE